MKKLIVSVLLLVFVLGLVGCESSKSVSDISDTQQTTTSEQPQSSVFAPLPVNIDLTKLDDCTVAVSLEDGSFYTDETGAVMMDVTVFVYDLYDMVDISLLEEGDTILRGQEEVLISSIERSQDGLILINGGLDEGGFCLYTEDNTVYYELGYSDTKSYYALGKVSLPVSPDFIYTDASNLDTDTAYFRAEDLLDRVESIDYHFNAHNTTIQIEEGFVTAMTRVYTP